MTFDLNPAQSGRSQVFEPGSSYKFDLPRGGRSIIKVVGVGGGGSNAVNHMFQMGIKDVEFIICNTDSQALKSSPVPVKLQIGTALTEGLGCGANPEVGRAAAIESHESIREALQGAKMVFITAGMGGGTGTGAAPVIAKIAKEMDILTVGIVTMPFDWEGRKKIQQANHGISALKENCDTVLVILNTRLREMFGNLAIRQAFAEADNVLTTAAKGIAEIITLTGYVNVDFQDVRTVMRNAGAAVMGSAETEGEDRAVNAARMALSSPLLDNKDIMGAKKILLSIISGEEAELQMDELSTITNYIQEQAGARCEVIFGHGVDPMLGHRIRVTVIATGFHDSKRRAKKQEKIVVSLDQPEMPAPMQDDFQPESLVEDEIRLINNDTPALEETSVLTEEPTKEEFSYFDEPEMVEDKIEETIKESYFEPEPPVTVTPTQEIKPIMLDLFNDFGKPEPVAAKSEPEWLEQDTDLPYSSNDQYEEEEESVGNRSAELEQNDENELSIMEKNRTRERLEAQAQARRERLTEAKRPEMSREEFNEKWTQPAYLRKGVKMENVPHSSQNNISRFNLNDDNSLLGNNKFLHDNVD